MAIQRLNYFTGQFLRENDFKVEQDYHLLMRRRHNKNVHTPGIVYGLEVIAGASQVTVQAGMAIDRDGREIVLESDTLVAIGTHNTSEHVVIALKEEKTDPAVNTDPIISDTRWTESAEPTMVMGVPAGAVGLAQIEAVAVNGAVTLKSDYRRIYSAPVVGGDLTVRRDLIAQGTVEFGDADTGTVTVKGAMLTGHSTGNLRIHSPVDVVGNIMVSGRVDGRDVSADGGKLDSHVESINNPHITTAEQVDTQGGPNKLVAQINVGSGIIAAARIDSAIARETQFSTVAGHDHDGTDSKKISPSDLAGVNVSVTSANLNVLTAGPHSDAAALHTHPFVPADNAVTLEKLDAATRSRLLRVPLLAQVFSPPGRVSLVDLSGGIAFDGTCFWVANKQTNTVLKIDPLTNVIAITVVVGARPSDVAFGGGYLWVANSKSNSVSKIDVSTNTLITHIPVGQQPTALAVSGAYLWTANYKDNTVSKVNMATHAVEHVPIGDGTNPSGLAVVGDFLWVANHSTDSVSKINMVSHKVMDTVTVGHGPRGLAAATGTFLWVANSASDTVSKVDVGAGREVSKISVGDGPYGVAVIGNFLWVSRANDRTLQKFDTTVLIPSRVAEVSSMFLYGEGYRMVSVAGFLWVAGQNQVTKIDVSNNKVAAELLPMESRGMAFDGRHLWVALYGSAQVLQVDINTMQIVRTVTVCTRPHSVVFNGRHVFVTNLGSNNVSKIDPLTGTVVATISVGSNPMGIAYNTVYRRLWVANSGDRSASVFDEDATSVAETFSLGSNPHSVACEGEYVWITNTDENTVKKLRASDGSGLVDFVVVAPEAIVFDYANMWVASAGTTGVSRLSVAVPPPDPLYRDLSAVGGPRAFPHRMYFNGTHHLIVLCSSGTYRVDVYNTNIITKVHSSPFNGWAKGNEDAPLAFDGVATWFVDNFTGELSRTLL